MRKVRFRWFRLSGVAGWLGIDIAGIYGVYRSYREGKLVWIGDVELHPFFFETLAIVVLCLTPVVIAGLLYPIYRPWFPDRSWHGIGSMNFTAIFRNCTSHWGSTTCTASRASLLHRILSECLHSKTIFKI